MFAQTGRLRQIRLILIAVFGIAFVITNIWYNFSHLDGIFPMRSVRDQHIYQEEDLSSGDRPDALLRELIRYKNVSLPYRVREYIEYNPIEDEDERGAGFVADYYIENNYTRYFEEYSKSSGYDEELPRAGEVAELIENGFSPGEFTDLGIANDMLRYTFLLNKEHSKETKYFWYSWYYYSFAEEEDHFPHIFVNFASCEGSDDLVAVWDEDENLYLMGREFYVNHKNAASSKNEDQN